MRLTIAFTPLITGAITAGVLAGSCTRQPTLDERRLSGLSELSAQIDQDRLMTYVNELVAEHKADTPIDCTLLDIDDHESEGCHLTSARARVYLTRKLQSFGYTVTEQVTTGGKTLTTTNVIAEKRGTKFPDEIVVVGAHYDAFHAAADDNSTGVAALLELAQLFANRDTERTLRFVGFDLEEFSLTGSTRYVREQAKDHNIVAGINFDSIGYRKSEPDSQKTPFGMTMPTTADFIAVVSNAQTAELADDVWLLNQRFKYTKVATIEAPARSEAPLTTDLLRSDHTPFWLADKPMLFFTDTTSFRNAHYHKPTDTVETLDPVFIAEVTRLAAGTIAYWAGGAQ